MMSERKRFMRSIPDQAQNLCNCELHRTTAGMAFTGNLSAGLISSGRIVSAIKTTVAITRGEIVINY